MVDLVTPHQCAVDAVSPALVCETVGVNSNDATVLDSAIDAFLAENDPKAMDNIAFRGARFDHGLAWVHFPEGNGGLGLRPDLNRVVERRMREAGAEPADPTSFFMALAARHFDPRLR